MRSIEQSGREVAASKAEILDVGGGEKVKVFDERPGYTKTPVPAVVVPGWGSTYEHYENFLSTLRQQGRRTVFVEALHGIETSEKGNLPAAGMQKVAALEAGLANKDKEKIDLLGHSEGGLIALEYAARNPEKVRSILLMNAAGVLGQDTFLRLAGRYGRDLAWQGLRHPTSVPKLFRPKGVREMALHPIRSFKEATAIAKAGDMTQVIDRLREKGIDLFVLQTASDRTFPPERAYERLGVEQDLESGKEPKAIVAWFAAGKDPKKERHTAPVLNSKFAEAADQLLDQTEQHAFNKEEKR